MDFRRALGGLFVLAVGVASAVACGDTEPPDVPTYGQPNGLSKQPLPPTGNEVSDGGGGGTGSSGSSSGGGSGSSSGSSSGGTTTQVTPGCVTKGGTIADGGTCSVSWSNQIFPAMQAGGAWGCMAAASCHGGSGLPAFSGTASQVYQTLSNYNAINSLYYFNPCSTDPTQSTFVCNTSTTTCESEMPLGAPLGTAAQTEIATWVACGAPQN